MPHIISAALIVPHVHYSPAPPTSSLSPIITFITQPRRTLQIINIYDINPLTLQLPPNPIPRTNGPTRLIPIPKHDPLTVRRSNLRSQQSQLCTIQARSRNGAEIRFEGCAGDGRDEGGDVAEGAVESPDRGVVEVVTRCYWLDLSERGIAGTDHSDGVGGEEGGCVYCREPAARLTGTGSQRFWL